MQWELGPERPGRRDEPLCSATRISDLKFEIAVASKVSGRSGGAARVTGFQKIKRGQDVETASST